MLFIVLRKIFNNKWLIACLLAGSILAVAMVSSIPMYTDGILQRMLVKDMENNKELIRLVRATWNALPAPDPAKRRKKNGWF